MRGNYSLKDWEAEKWKREFLRFIKRLETFKSENENIDLTAFDLCPSNVIDILELLGWEQSDFDSNGWEQDTWYDFAHPDYDFEVGFFYCGFTFQMYLSRKEKE